MYISLEEKLLNVISTNKPYYADFYSLLDIYNSACKQHKFSDADFDSAIKSLVENGYIEFSEKDNTSFRLTNKGLHPHKNHLISLVKGFVANHDKVFKAVGAVVTAYAKYKASK